MRPAPTQLLGVELLTKKHSTTFLQPHSILWHSPLSLVVLFSQLDSQCCDENLVEDDGRSQAVRALLKRHCQPLQQRRRHHQHFAHHRPPFRAPEVLARKRRLLKEKWLRIHRRLLLPVKIRRRRHNAETNHPQKR